MSAEGDEPREAHSASREAPPLAVRLPNWVGDVCMALPALSALGERRPLRLFGKGWAVELLAGMAWTVEKLPTGVRAAAAAVRSSGARDGLLFTNSFGSALAFRWAGLRATGYRAELRGLLLGRAVSKPRGLHEVETFWRLALAHLGRAPAPPPGRLGLNLQERHRQQARDALAAAGVSGAYTVLCPLAVGAADGRSKVWPSFPLLCRGLIEGGDAVVACPGPGEEGACAAALPGARMLPGLGLGAYAAVLAGARRVAANDTGPMHLAAAVDAPVVGIFGVSDPRRTAPWSAGGTFCGSSSGWPALAEVVRALDRVAR
jgi:heptosyltransferase-2